MTLIRLFQSDFTRNDFLHCPIADVEEAVIHATMKGDFITFEIFGTSKKAYRVNFYRVLEGAIAAVDPLYEQLVTYIFVKDEMFNALYRDGRKIAIAVEWEYRGIIIKDCFISSL